MALRSGRCMGDAGQAEHALIALDLVGGTERFLKVVGEFHRRVAIGVVELADKIYGIEGVAALRIAVAKIIGQQGAPACAETDAALGNPFTLIEEVACLPKIGGRSAVADGPGKIGMQSQNRVHIERVRGDE